MKKYKSNFYATILLIFFVIILYIIKNLNIIQKDVKIFAYLIVLNINLFMLFSTLVSVKAMRSLLNHNLFGENAKTKVGFLIATIKDITNTKTNICFLLLAFIATIGWEVFLFVLENLNYDVYKITDLMLDFIAVLSLSNTFLQSHINYTIHRYLSDK